MKPLLALGVALVTLLLLVVGRLTRSPVLRRLRGPLTLLVLASLFSWAVGVTGSGGRWDEAASVTLLLVLSLLLIRVSLLVVFEWLPVSRVGIEVPRLARDVVALVLYLVAAAVILRDVLGLEVGALLATSAVVTVVIGLALQETLGTLLAGLTLTWERRVEAGTWIEVDGVLGEIEEVAWRSTVLRTTLGERVMVPNSHVARTQVKILGHGDAVVAVTPRIRVSYAAPPHAVKQVLLAVAADLPGLADKPPQAFAKEFAEDGVLYEVRLWTPTPWRMTDHTDDFLTHAHAALARAGFEVPVPQRAVRLAPAAAPADPVARSLAALSRCALFAGLPETALVALAGASHPLVFAPGEAVVREGEASRALYVVTRGEASVWRGDQVVGSVGTGEVFGEMAFLSGESRSATVRAAGHLEVVEVDSAALRVLLAEHGELAEELAQRMVARQQALAAHDAAPTDEHTRGGLMSFFRSRLHQLVSG
jgi:small-conductance mechanosensitive channel/CRP-like cAMP-binding protein